MVRTHPRLLTALLLLSGSSLDFARQDQGTKGGLEPGAEVFLHGPGVDKGSEWEGNGTVNGRILKDLLKVVALVTTLQRHTIREGSEVF